VPGLQARRVKEAQAWLQDFYRKHDIKPAERSMSKQEMDDIIGYGENGMW